MGDLGHCLVPGLLVANMQDEETSSTPDQLVAWSAQHTGFGPATDPASAHASHGPASLCRGESCVPPGVRPQLVAAAQVLPVLGGRPCQEAPQQNLDRLKPHDILTALLPSCI